MFSERWNKLRRKKYREAFVLSAFKRIVPFQIYAMRKKRGWSQQKLAIQANVTQGVISRAEDPDYGNLTINTICRIAAGFDVAFIGKFVSFSELDKWLDNLSEESGIVSSFQQEDTELAATIEHRLDKLRVIGQPQKRAGAYAEAGSMVPPIKIRAGEMGQIQQIGAGR